MNYLGPAGEWLRLAEHYREMTDGELIDLARRPSELTGSAQQALAQEMLSRRLKVPPDVMPPSRPAPPPDNPDENDPYAEDRELVEICTVWSLNDALKIQRLLDAASIPFYMGPEKATSVDTVTSDFSKGVAVKVMRIGVPWTWRVLENYEPADEPPEEKAEIDLSLAIHCPACRSTDVILQKLAGDSTAPSEDVGSKFSWLCAVCGRKWQDDGMVSKF